MVSLQVQKVVSAVYFWSQYILVYSFLKSFLYVFLSFVLVLVEIRDGSQ